MRNTKHKLFRDKSLKHLHDDLNIIGVVGFTTREDDDALG